MPEIKFVTKNHTKTKRDYLARVNEFPKAEAARRAKEFGKDYWDGDRKFGYGGYRYDGRWESVAREMAAHYGLKAGSRILDVGCGKAFLLHDFTRVVPGIEAHGVDISRYGIENAKEEMRGRLKLADATKLPFPDKHFDFVYSITTFHNLYCFDLEKALREVVRVARKHAYICVESYRNEYEKANLLYWQLTCEMFCTPDEWRWWFNHAGYQGDYEFIFFE